VEGESPKSPYGAPGIWMISAAICRSQSRHSWCVFARLFSHEQCFIHISKFSTALYCFRQQNWRNNIPPSYANASVPTGLRMRWTACEKPCKRNEIRSSYGYPIFNWRDFKLMHLCGSNDFLCSNSRQQVVAKVTDSTINRTPKPNLWKLTENLFSTHSWRRTLSNGQLGLFKTPLTVSVRSEVTLLGLKLKVAVLSIHSWKFVYTACLVREVIAYECTHVWASEKSGICKPGYMTEYCTVPSAKSGPFTVTRQSCSNPG
jgi:hypothetical protein